MSPLAASLVLGLHSGTVDAGGGDRQAGRVGTHLPIMDWSGGASTSYPGGPAASREIPRLNALSETEFFAFLDDHILDHPHALIRDDHGDESFSSWRHLRGLLVDQQSTQIAGHAEFRDRFLRWLRTPRAAARMEQAYTRIATFQAYLLAQDPTLRSIAIPTADAPPGAVLDGPAHLLPRPNWDALRIALEDRPPPQTGQRRPLTETEARNAARAEFSRRAPEIRNPESDLRTRRDFNRRMERYLYDEDAMPTETRRHVRPEAERLRGIESLLDAEVERGVNAAVEWNTRHSPKRSHPMSMIVGEDEVKLSLGSDGSVPHVRTFARREDGQYDPYFLYHAREIVGGTTRTRRRVSRHYRSEYLSAILYERRSNPVRDVLIDASLAEWRSYLSVAEHVRGATAKLGRPHIENGWMPVGAHTFEETIELARSEFRSYAEPEPVVLRPLEEYRLQPDRYLDTILGILEPNVASTRPGRLEYQDPSSRILPDVQDAARDAAAALRNLRDEARALFSGLASPGPGRSRFDVLRMTREGLREFQLPPGEASETGRSLLAPFRGLNLPDFGFRSFRGTNFTPGTAEESTPIFRVTGDVGDFLTRPTVAMTSRTHVLPAEENPPRATARVESRAPRTALGAHLGVPTPQGLALTEVELRIAGTERTFTRGTDYEVLYSQFDEAYLLRLSEPLRAQYEGLPVFEFSAGFAPRAAQHRIARRVDPNSLPELSRLDLDRLQGLASQLTAGGLADLGTALSRRVERARRSRSAISLGDLETLLRDNARYVYTAEGPVRADASGPFADFSRFVDVNGRLCYQCSGAGTLFAEMLSQYFHDDPRFSAMVRTGYHVSGSSVTPEAAHARTELRFFGRVVAVLDATPREAFADALRRRWQAILGRLRARPPQTEIDPAELASETTGGPHRSAPSTGDAPDLRLARAAVIRERLGTIRSHRHRIVEMGLGLGVQRMRDSPLIRETLNLARIAEELSSGDLSIADAATALPRVPELAGLETDDFSGAFRLVAARATALRREIPEQNTHLARQRGRVRRNAPPLPIEDPLLREALTESLDTVAGWPTDSSVSDYHAMRAQDRIRAPDLPALPTRAPSCGAGAGARSLNRVLQYLPPSGD